jgi:hypothetical protein
VEFGKIARALDEVEVFECETAVKIELQIIRKANTAASRATEVFPHGLTTLSFGSELDSFWLPSSLSNIENFEVVIS